MNRVDDFERSHRKDKKDYTMRRTRTITIKLAKSLLLCILSSVIIITTPQFIRRRYCKPFSEVRAKR